METKEAIIKSQSVQGVAKSVGLVDFLLLFVVVSFTRICNTKYFKQYLL